MIFDIYLYFKDRPECRWQETYHAPLLKTQAEAWECAECIVDDFNDHLAPNVQARGISRVFAHEVGDDGNEGHVWEKAPSLTDPDADYIVLQCAMCKRTGKLYSPTQFSVELTDAEARILFKRQNCKGPERTRRYHEHGAVIMPYRNRPWWS